jgi:hypothetical protein
MCCSGWRWRSQQIRAVAQSACEGLGRHETPPHVWQPTHGRETTGKCKRERARGIMAEAAPAEARESLHRARTTDQAQLAEVCAAQ